MKVVCATLTAKPGVEEALEGIFSRLFDHVKEEAGTLFYTLNKSCDRPEVYFFYERYQDEKAAQDHLMSDVLQGAIAAMQELLTTEPTVDVCDIVDMADVADKSAGKAYVKDGDTAMWVRRDMVNRQKAYCACWKCMHFKPEQNDHGCAIIDDVLRLAAERGIVLPVWACKSFVGRE